MSSPRLTYYNISPDTVAFSTTRHGGVSTGNYASLNINPYCGDAPEAVAANRLRLAAELGVDEGRIVLPHQTHGTETRVIDGGFMLLTANERQRLLDGVDAVLTDVPGLCIGVSTADCIPVLLYDAEHRAAAAVHAGWRGTQARILQKAVSGMCAVYGTEPARLKAVIGPGISLDSFEVGDEVYAAFEEAGFDMGAIAARRAKWHIDLPLANRLQLTRCGVDEANITTLGTCTYANADEYFSARRLGTASGRIYTGIYIKTGG